MIIDNKNIRIMVKTIYNYNNNTKNNNNNNGSNNDQL